LKFSYIHHQLSIRRYDPFRQGSLQSERAPDDGNAGSYLDLLAVAECQERQVFASEFQQYEIVLRIVSEYAFDGEQTAVLGFGEGAGGIFDDMVVGKVLAVAGDRTAKDFCRYRKTSSITAGRAFLARAFRSICSVSP
jgi:hypothetical protein